jgi:tetratricopeptide (TPR) repeat protein
MNGAGSKRVAAGLVLLVAAWAASAVVQVAIERRMAAYRDAPDVLWVPSGKVLKRLSLGYDGLMADIYWTRAVQYYGGQRRDRKTDFSMLGPLLDITVDLDPYLLIAYKFGAIFLSEPSPRGAGQPQQAIRLIQKGIQANPDEWRLWHDLGFLYYWDLKDYPAAAAAFLEGSKNPHAAPWMKVMAAVILQKGGDRETSHFLWTEIYQSAEDPSIRQNAREHLQALQATEDSGKPREWGSQ